LLHAASLGSHRIRLAGASAQHHVIRSPTSRTGLDDIPVLAGVDLRPMAWTTRRERLELLAEAFDGPIRLSPVVSPSTALVLDMERGDLEGIVLKDRESAYRDGSREEWHKVKDRSWYEREAWRFDRARPIEPSLRPSPMERRLVATERRLAVLYHKLLCELVGPHGRELRGQLGPRSTGLYRALRDRLKERLAAAKGQSQGVVFDAIDWAAIRALATGDDVGR
jgi:ATP-dependent DNA ligase